MNPFDSAEDFRGELRNSGEMMVVLESDREYALHPHDTTVYTDMDDPVIETEGIREGGHEYIEATFPLDAVEHFYVHREA